MKLPKNRTKENVKANSWKIFSKYIRLKYADNNGFVKCITCGTVKHYKEMQAGHYLHNKADYDEENIHPQCVKCNKYLNGNLAQYEKFMQKTYGSDKVDLLIWRANQTCKKDILWYLDIEQEVKAKLKRLFEEKPYLKGV